MEYMPEKSLAQANPPLSLLAIIPIVLTGFFYLYEYILRVYPSVFRIEIEQFYAFSGASGFGFFASSYYYLYTPLQLFVGILADKFRLQSLLVFSISGCLSGLLLLLVPIDIAAFLGRMLLGMASAAGFVLIIKATSLYAPRHYFAFFLRPWNLSWLYGCTNCHAHEYFFSETWTWLARDQYPFYPICAHYSCCYPDWI